MKWKGMSVVTLYMALLVFGSAPALCADSGFRVFWIETDRQLPENDRPEPVQDFYINGGEESGLSESMILDVYREKTIADAGKKSFQVYILVGQIKIIKLFKDSAIARIISLTDTDSGPVLTPRTVMLGDYVFPVGEDYTFPAKKGDDASAGDTAAGTKETFPEKVKKNVPLASCVIFPSNVIFSIGEWELQPEALDALSVVHDMFNRALDKDILIEGHTCSLGSDADNLVLSRKRAESVSDYLVKTKGVPGEHIRVKYFGEKLPMASNDTEEGRLQNRRVTIRFLPRNKTDSSLHTSLK